MIIHTTNIDIGHEGDLFADYNEQGPSTVIYDDLWTALVLKPISFGRTRPDRYPPIGKRTNWIRKIRSLPSARHLNIGYRDRGPRRRHRTPGLKHVASILLHFHDTAVLAPLLRMRARIVYVPLSRPLIVCPTYAVEGPLVPARPTKYEPSAAGSPTPSLAP